MQFKILHCYYNLPSKLIIDHLSNSLNLSNIEIQIIKPKIVLIPNWLTCTQYEEVVSTNQSRNISPNGMRIVVPTVCSSGAQWLNRWMKGIPTQPHGTWKLCCDSCKRAMIQNAMRITRSLCARSTSMTSITQTPLGRRIRRSRVREWWGARRTWSTAQMVIHATKLVSNVRRASRRIRCAKTYGVATYAAMIRWWIAICQ